jgi:alpha-L-rhamnosidase
MADCHIRWDRRSQIFVALCVITAVTSGTPPAQSLAQTNPDQPGSTKAISATAASDIWHHVVDLPRFRARHLDLSPAQWIWLPAERTLPNTFVLFRKEFELAANPVRAWGWITADSRYKLFVNGKRVQWGPAPCDPRNLDVDPIDLSKLLVKGRNVIAVEVLYYGLGDGTWPGGKPGLIMNLDVQTRDDHVQVVTDASWQAAVDRAHPVGQYKRWFLRSLQEQFDARLHPHGWNQVGFAPEQPWTAAREIPCPADKPASCRSDGHWCGDSVARVDPAVASLRMRQIPLCSEMIVPVKQLAHSGLVTWHRDPADWFDMRIADSFEVSRDPVLDPSSSGEWTVPATRGEREGIELTFEFEEQVVGFPRFVVDAPAGTTIEVMVQEGHDASKTRWLDSHHYSWSRFICREGINCFEASDFESLRWLQLHIRNAASPVTIRNVEVRRRVFPWPHEPLLHCSEPTLQRLFDASFNTIRNSAIETIVDGMGRERQQYSGDCGHQLHAIRYLWGGAPISRRYLRTFSEGMTLDGYFMDCWPAHDRLARIAQKQTQSAYWGPLLDHGIGFNFDCWHHYLELADRDGLVEPYPRLVRFADYLQTIRDQHGLLKVEGLGIPTVWIDHIAYRQQRHKQCAFNLYAAAMLKHALAPIAELFDGTERADAYRQFSDQLLAATIQRYWSAKQSLFVDNLPWLQEEGEVRLSDRTLATAILFDQCPGGATTASLDALVDCPPTMGFSYPCNAGWRLWALAKGGRSDVILKDFRTRWATMESVLKNNSLQEDWQAAPDSRAQWSHCALAPLFVTMQDIAGIRPTSPGFAACQIRPQLADLPNLETAVVTRYGWIRFHAELMNDQHHIELQLPKGIQAELLLPPSAATKYERLTPDHPHGLKRYRLPEGASEFTIPTMNIGQE